MPAASDILQYFRGQLFETPTLPNTSFEGKTVVITGSNTGLGFECAKHLIGLKVSTLVLACRSISKGEDAKARLLASSNAKYAPSIHVCQVDMSSYASVTAFAARLEQLPRLDALVANAGISTTEFNLAEGLESTLTVNVVSTILLAVLALPKLERTAHDTGEDTHLTITGSVVQSFADPMELQRGTQGDILRTLTRDGKSSMRSRYFLSKLVLQLAFQELSQRASRLSGDGKSGESSARVVINSTSPGWCKTQLFRQDDGGFWARNLLKLIGRTPEVGARTLTSAVGAGRETHGHYLSECIVKPASAFARSPEGSQVQTELWAELSAIMDRVQPGMMSVLA